MMQIALSEYHNSQFMLGVQRLVGRTAPFGSSSGTSTAAGSTADKTAAAFNPSLLTILAASQNFSELSVQDQSVTMAYRRDGSLSLRSSSSISINIASQDIALDVILPAESLGVPLPADLFKNGPAQIQLEYQFEAAQSENKFQAKTVKTTRKVEDILMDLTKALGEVFRRKGDKNVQILFDEEAIRSLFAESGAAGIIKELAALICMVNTMVLDGGQRERYQIEISGKGKPYLDVQDHTQVEIERVHLRLNLVVLPPEETPADTEAIKQAE